MGNPQYCWRQCGQLNADHSHIFWNCDKLRSFWDCVIGILEEVLGYNVTSDPRVLYLGLSLEDTIGQEDTYLFKILILAAKKAITRRWLEVDPPRTDHWLDIVEEIRCMEKMTYNIRTQAEVYEKRWVKWHLYTSKSKSGMQTAL